MIASANYVFEHTFASCDDATVEKAKRILLSQPYLWFGGMKPSDEQAEDVAKKIISAASRRPNYH